MTANTTELLTLGKTGIDTSTIHSGLCHGFSSFRDMVEALFKRGNAETDTNHVIIVIVGSLEPHTQLDALLYADKALLLRYFFAHLNMIVLHESEICPSLVVRLNKVSQNINSMIENRISRVEMWTGTAPENPMDVFTVSDTFMLTIPTMSLVLTSSVNKSQSTTKHLIRLKNIIVDEIDFKLLLSNHSPEHLSKLSHLVGHWAFPAHELTNDDLVYCVYLMIEYALRQVKKRIETSKSSTDNSTTTPSPSISGNQSIPSINPITDSGIECPNPNELLAFVFMVRDTYKNGNPFHNFRHAVDVVHACFHFLTRLHCLPPFIQLEADTQADELRYLRDQTTTSKHEKLTETGAASAAGSATNVGMDELQTLGLLIAALGHDVGHPGVTNAFMIKHGAPTSVVYNERSVLELYHTTVFINKILAVNWPLLLRAKAGDLMLKDLIITSILATDMAEHFEYLNRLSILNKYSDHVARVKLLSSLLIKCADISNVSRPLRVSSQWAMMLAREFEEVSLLEQRLELSLLSVPKVAYDPVPTLVEEVLRANPNIHKGQIFFINTFAEKLFENVADILSELQFTCDIIGTNKNFWLTR